MKHPLLQLAALLAVGVVAFPVAAAARAAAAAPGAAHGRAENAATREQMRWQREAGAVSIVRDSWGIAHIYGGTDADAVFGAMYAQAEDDFSRIERNYLVALGRLAQMEGRPGLYSDLRQRMFVDTADLQRLYRASPGWLKSLMIAWADGLNFYLAVHPRSTVIGRFEPWMALSFTEGSIGGDIESAELGELERLYPDGAGQPPPLPIETPPVPLKPTAPPEAASPAAAGGAAWPGGSNGFAIAPSRTASGHALLWINPHTSFYFRSELQLTSDQGLDVYGAATWGQFFIYQGFNARNGWMHTSYGGDAIDEYAESVLDTPQGPGYRYAGGVRPLAKSVVAVLVKQGSRLVAHRFTVYRSHHGPIVRAEGGKWIALKIFQDPVRALEQSYLRTKTADYQSFRRTQEMRTDTSNNTVYADADGTIAYFHGNFIPRRDARIDFRRPVDGSDPTTEWHGAHRLEETITLLNPSNGWIQNTNNWPFSAAGSASPKRDNYPVYMWTRGENPRGLHAVEVLEKLQGATLDSLIAAAYDPHLTAFDALLPALLAAYDRLDGGDPRRATLQEPIASLRAWDRRSATESIPTTLAVIWGEQLAARAEARADAADEPLYDYLLAHLTDEERLEALREAVERLEHDMGSWKIAWGQINRFQRLNDDRLPLFDDEKPSLPVGFASAQWGSLASFDYPMPRSTRHIFGSIGNSFVAAVEFGPTVRAKAIMTGGESGDPASPHFADQAVRYSEGRLRDVWFTPTDVSAHADRRYHPGER